MSLPDNAIFKFEEEVVFVVEYVDDGEASSVVEHVFFSREGAFAYGRFHFVYRLTAGRVILLSWFS